MAKGSNKENSAGLAPLLTVSLVDETGVLDARQRARQLAELLGFGQQDQIRLATATSEIARNAAQYGKDGLVEFFADLHAQPSRLTVRVSDKGPGIRQSDEILDGRYQSQTGMGIGLSGTRRLMDHFILESLPAKGTVVTFSKNLPPDAKTLSSSRVAQFSEELARERPRPAGAEIRQQNQELLVALEAIRKLEAELAKRQQERLRIDQELEETNRGVVALYAELDERALALRQANEVKTRFLSYMSHEFRTPLNAILALADLLIRRVDGDLTTEQERQIKFVQVASNELLEMVSDLLDIAKVESGKVDLRLGAVEAARIFSALRGMMRPLIQNDLVNLIFEEPPAGLAFLSDEGKINQILRNLISNALKFTERGEVRVAVRIQDSQIEFSVSDTGIGIDPQHQDGIFREFSQIENPVQRRVRGTGLGLPLSRKLAELLGGSLTVASALREGSTFLLSLPFSVERQPESGGQPFHGEVTSSGSSPFPALTDPGVDMILVIDDDEVARYLVRQQLRTTHYLVTEASGGIEGVERARFDQPSLIMLDIAMPDCNGFDAFDELKSDPATRHIPVIVHTSGSLSEMDLVRLNGRHAAVLSKQPEDQGRVADMITSVLKQRTV